jgi:hypothetical protein
MTNRRNIMSNNKLHSTAELLTINEFTEKANICRTTVFKWMKNGILIVGEHYIKEDKVIRIVWSKDLINHLLHLSRIKAPKKAHHHSQIKNTKRLSSHSKTAMNWDY